MQHTIAKVEGPLPWTHKASGSVNHDFKLRFEGSDDKFVITQKPTSAVPQVGQSLDVEMLGPHPMHDGFTKVKKAQTFQQNGQSQQSFQPADDPTRASIEAQTAIKAAVEYARAFSSPPDANTVSETAKVFFRAMSEMQQS
jgi:hypothetical protein